MPPAPPRSRLRRWISTHRRLTVALVLLAGFGLLNVWAFRHAWVMTHFADGGPLTLRPEQLSTFGKVKVLLAGVNIPRPANDQTPADVGLTFETHRILCDGGVELEAWRVPHAEPRATVLLFHGYAACKSRLLKEARTFHDLGCESILVDFRGSGGSSGNVTTLGIYEADDVARSVEFAKPLAGNRPLVLYGRSMGSVAILRAIAVQDIDPAAIIIECPFDRLLTTVGHRFEAVGLPAFPGAHLLVFWGGVQHGMNGFSHNPVDYAARVHCPVLLLHGEHDPRVGAGEVQAICDCLPCEKQFEVFPGVGHESCCRARPERWRELVAALLDRLDN